MKKQCNPGVGGNDETCIDGESEVLHLDDCLAYEATDPLGDDIKLE